MKFVKQAGRKLNGDQLAARRLRVEGMNLFRIDVQHVPLRQLQALLADGERKPPCQYGNQLRSRMPVRLAVANLRGKHVQLLGIEGNQLVAAVRRLSSALRERTGVSH